MKGGDTMPARIIPNISHLEKHLMGYAKLLRKQHYQHFKHTVLAIIDQATSIAQVARKSGTPTRTLEYFFNDSFFNDQALLTHSARVMQHYTPTRSTKEAFLILDFTSTKTGKRSEWADWLWNEETDEPDLFGYEQCLALEVNPVKKYRRCLGYRRFYHTDALYQTEYWRGDFEKKPVCVSRLLKQVAPLTCSKQVIVDGEFMNCFLINRFEQLRFNWTGRIRKSLSVNYKRGKYRLEVLAEKLNKEGKLAWQRASYRNQAIQTAKIIVNIPSLANRKVTIAVCKNRQGNIAFLGTNIDCSAYQLVSTYAQRWEIEVFIKDIKQALSFADYKMRRVGANSRWQILCLVAANLMELVRKIKLEPLMQSRKSSYSWFKLAVKRLYQRVKLTLGITVSVIRDLRQGGRELIASLKAISYLNNAKNYLYNGINFAEV